MTDEARITIYNIILNYILSRGLQDYDDFSQKLTEEIIKNFSRKKYNLKEIINQISTPFFRLNSLKRSEFLNKDLEIRIIDAWKRTMKHVELRVKTPQPTARKDQLEIKCKQIYVEDIDSFKKVKEISPSEVKNIIPLNLKERFIKESFAEIIGEQFIPNDWGGELCDLFTTRVLLNGKRVNAAFLLKGRGLKKKLTIADCGKNGDQINRLVKLPATLFIVQHVREIDPAVLEQLEALVEKKSRSSNKKLYYCLIDGVDTARILLAYGKIKQNHFNSIKNRK